MQKTISKETPLAEIILRKYEKPANLKGRELIRKLCLSIGLLQPGDSRDAVVDVLYAILMNKSKKGISSEEIKDKVIELRKKHKLAMLGVASSNIRRQLKRLRDLFLIESKANKYRINENTSLIDIFEEKIKKFYLEGIVNRVEDYFKAVNKDNLKKQKENT